MYKISIKYQIIELFIKLIYVCNDLNNVTLLFSIQFLKPFYVL